MIDSRFSFVFWHRWVFSPLTKCAFDLMRSPTLFFFLSPSSPKPLRALSVPCNVFPAVLMCISQVVIKPFAPHLFSFSLFPPFDPILFLTTSNRAFFLAPTWLNSSWNFLPSFAPRSLLLLKSFFFVTRFLSFFFFFLQASGLTTASVPPHPFIWAWWKPFIHSW